MKLIYEKNNLLIFLTVLILLLPLNFYANDARAPEWLNYSIGARAIALGQTFTAFADDATAAFNNPAGLPKVVLDEPGHSLWVSSTFAFMPEKRILGALSTSFRINKFVLGVGALFTNGIDYLNADRKPADNQKDYAIAPMITFASSLSENETISFGGNIKYINSKTDNVKANGMAFDFGGYVAVINMISIGAFIKNLGFIKYDDIKTRFIAPTVSFGIGYNPITSRTFGFCIHIERNTGDKDAKFIASGGLFIAVWANEYLSNARTQSPVDETTVPIKKPKIFYNAIYVNMGFHGKEFSCGLTFNIFGFKLDYGFLIHTTESNRYSHVITLEKRF